MSLYLPLLGRKFTWCNSSDGEKWSKIDRVLVDPKWLEVFQLKLWGLPRLLSDHSSLILMEDERDWGPKPFRFQNTWLLHKNFHSFLEKTWKEFAVVGWAGYILLEKLKNLKVGLKKWNVEVFGNITNKLKATEVELHRLELVADARDLDDTERRRRREVRGEVWRLSKMVERLWSQKSRMNWALMGDRNTRFFHSHFLEEWNGRPGLGGSFNSVQGSGDFNRLEAKFSEVEIKAALMDCDGNKAPGPDGFNMGCF
ncbi:uncharacterized protein LOC114296865 [Camellia sinensis]|uniref:uncharacterized protein LOC114296865 n=1 Tax=Camellia sinensis TaxID=4442 RepID=UPI001036A3FF|nr:uncharacterized protein LOC114296865 [Camellia sinensis]